MRNCIKGFLVQSSHWLHEEKGPKHHSYILASTVVFQYPFGYTILHVVGTSTWLLAPFMQHFTTIVQWMAWRTQRKYNPSFCKTNCNCWVWNHSVGYCTLWKYPFHWFHYSIHSIPLILDDPEHIYLPQTLYTPCLLSRPYLKITLCDISVKG